MAYAAARHAPAPGRMTKTFTRVPQLEGAPMFTATKNQPPKASKKPAPGRDANAVTILTTGCHFSGKLYCRGASRIGGKIDGQIVSEGLLIVEEEAVITAEIK